MDLTQVSKFISLILRHKPETINITLDEHGWANVDELIDGITKQYPGFGMKELEETTPPDILYHGTATKFEAAIDKEGLIPKSRLYVHLSKDIDTAYNVGIRHGSPIIYEVDTVAMLNDGYKFYISANGVWLTKTVPVKYLTKKV